MHATRAIDGVRQRWPGPARAGRDCLQRLARAGHEAASEQALAADVALALRAALPVACCSVELLASPRPAAAPRSPSSGWPSALGGRTIAVTVAAGGAPQTVTTTLPSDHVAVHVGQPALRLLQVADLAAVEGRPPPGVGVRLRAATVVPLPGVDGSAVAAWSATRGRLSSAHGALLVAAAHILASSLERLRCSGLVDEAGRRDPITGLLSRTGVHAALVEHLLQGTSSALGPEVAVLRLDIDAFRALNDSLGLVAADELLAATGERLREALQGWGAPAGARPPSLGRWGADEFVVVAPAGAGEAQALAARLHMALADPVALPHSGQPSVHVGMTTGIAVSSAGAAQGAYDPHPGEGAQAAGAGAGDQALGLALLARADRALASAKESRRGRWEIFSAQRHRRGSAHPGLDSDLRRALADSELRVAYQPVVELATGSAVAVEALVRWEHPERGLLAPVAFVQAAEQAGLDSELGRQVLARAVADAATLAAEGAALRVCVNVSARHLLNPGFASELAMLLADGGLPGRLLGVEITESAALDASPTLSRTLAEVRELGVALLLDDFGTGFASFERLRRLPLDTLKLDRSLVEGITTSPREEAVVAAVLALARALGLGVVAEGVEDAATAVALRRLGCERAQGYHYSRALPPEQLLGWLRAHAVAAGPAPLRERLAAQSPPLGEPEAPLAGMPAGVAGAGG